MASRKKPKLDPEIVENDAGQDAKPVGKQIVEAKHTITYNKPIVVDSEPEDEPEEIEDDEQWEIEDKPKRKKKTEKELRNALRDRLAQKGVTPTSQLRVHIFRFENDNDSISGVQAEKAFCTKIFTSEDGIINGQHLDAAQKFGPGRYLFMVYMNNAIVTSFEERISAPSFGQPVIQNGQPVVTMPDPQNPNVIVQMPASQPQQQSDPFADLDKSLKFIERMERMRQALGISPAPIQNPVPAQSPEISVAELLMKDPHHAKKIVGNLIGGEGEKDLMALAFEHGPALIQSLGDVIRNIISDVRGNNGTAQMAQAAFQDNGQAQSRQQGLGQTGQIQEVQETNNGQALESHHQAIPEGTIAIRPEDELLAGILDHCKRKMPPKLAADRAMKYAEYIEQIAPQQSVWIIIEQFTDNPIEESLALLELVNPEAGTIIALPHAKEWATQLQAELKKAYEPGGAE